MKSTLDKKDGLSRRLNIEVPVERVQDAFNKVYSGIQKNVELKGFRKGKAPIAQVKALYADRARQDVIKDLVNESFHMALHEHRLNPVGQPELKLGALDEDQGFTFTADFEVRPEIEIKDFEGLKLEREKLELANDRIDQVLQNLREERSERIPLIEDRGAAQGDVLTIDFEGFQNGEPLASASATDHELEIGSEAFIPGFEEGLVGCRPGSTTELNLAFPEEYHNAELSGQPVQFKVTVKKIEKKSLPELNDEFAKSVGKFENLDQLKSSIEQELKSREQQRIESDLKDRALKRLIEKNPIQVPSTLVAEQRERLVSDLHQRMHQQGLSQQDFEEYVRKWKDDFDRTATEMVQGAFLVETLAQKLNLHATANDIDQRIVANAQAIGLQVDQLQDYYRQPEKRSNLEFQITEEKVISYLIDKAKISEVEASRLRSAKNA